MLVTILSFTDLSNLSFKYFDFFVFFALINLAGIKAIFERRVFRETLPLKLTNLTGGFFLYFRLYEINFFSFF